VTADAWVDLGRIALSPPTQNRPGAHYRLWDSEVTLYGQRTATESLPLCLAPMCRPNLLKLFTEVKVKMPQVLPVWRSGRSKANTFE